MQKSFQKSLLAVAAAAALSSTAFAAEVGTNKLIFPYISTASTAYSFITLTNRGSGSTNTSSGAANRLVNVPMHFVYGTKAQTAANSAACEHADGDASATANDVMTFEVMDKVNMFTLTGEGVGTVPSPLTSSYYPLAAANTGRHGFLIVNGNNAPVGTTLYGSAVVIDTATGLVTSYKALNTTVGGATTADFAADNTGVAGGPIPVNPAGAVGGALPALNNANASGDADGTHGVNVVSWLPAGTVTTSWFVVPLGTEGEMSPPTNGGLTAGYLMMSDAFTQGGAYDVNENFNSGTTAAIVRCVGTITRADMLSTNPLANTTNGGTANLITYNRGADPTAPTVAVEGAPLGGRAFTSNFAHKSLVYKIQSTTALGGRSSVNAEPNL